ncbi:MAG: hypothetical protein VXZ88_07010, partial [Verrucomicrobiota bacterium]|nr:hypothetical protein [Verrucomicrobiota bacterium]
GCIDDARQNDKGISLHQVCAKRAQNAKYLPTAADSSPLRNIAITESWTRKTREQLKRSLALGARCRKFESCLPHCHETPDPNWQFSRPARGGFFVSWFWGNSSEPAWCLQRDNH